MLLTKQAYNAELMTPDGLTTKTELRWHQNTEEAGLASSHFS
jgi:hypothetical protein